MNEFKIGFPLSFLTSNNVRSLIFGQTFARIDNHRQLYKDMAHSLSNDARRTMIWRFEWLTI